MKIELKDQGLRFLCGNNPELIERISKGELVLYADALKYRNVGHAKGDELLRRGVIGPPVDLTAGLSSNARRAIEYIVERRFHRRVAEDFHSSDTITLVRTAIIQYQHETGRKSLLGMGRKTQVEVYRWAGLPKPFNWRPWRFDPYSGERLKHRKEKSR